MCTVSIVPRDGGVRVVCNRDERRTRRPALSPSRRRIGSRAAVFPVDGDRGGTWIGANDRGLVVALLNASAAPAPRADVTSGCGSRGVIVPMLLGCARLPDLLAAAWTIDRRRFPPFRILAVQGSSVAIVTSGPRMWRVRSMTLAAPLMLTSSSLGDALVDAPRQRLFARLMAARRDQWLDAQRRFHQHRWTHRPHLSVLMARPDARTVSRTVVDVTRGCVTLGYEPIEETEAG